MNIRNLKDNEFDGTINISSNIKDNKNTIIGKFDLRDLLFILIAGVVGITALSVLIAVLSIKSVFVIFIVLAILEIPIITLGFLKLHNIPALDYIKMKSKSDNSEYRKQVHRIKRDKSDKYLMVFVIEFDIERLEEIINEIHKFISFNRIEIKIMFNLIYLIIEVREDFDIDYDNLFKYLKNNNYIKFVSYEDMKNYKTFIRSLKFESKKYSKKQSKIINKIKNQFDKLKIITENNDKYDYLTNKIIECKDKEFIKIYKVLLYETPFDIKIFAELKDICNITIHTNVVINDEVSSIDLLDLNYINTFISIIGASYASPSIDDFDRRVKEVLDKYHILYKEITEEKVKESLLFLMENSY